MRPSVYTGSIKSVYSHKQSTNQKDTAVLPTYLPTAGSNERMFRKLPQLMQQWQMFQYEKRCKINIDIHMASRFLPHYPHDLRSDSIEPSALSHNPPRIKYSSYESKCISSNDPVFPMRRLWMACVDHLKLPAYGLSLWGSRRSRRTAKCTFIHKWRYAE